ncbi:Endonuclease/exonuclease/phosphatase [Aspergillus varians]
MEALFAQAIRDSTALRKTSVPWKLDEPHPQSYYDYDPTTSTWVSKSPSPDPTQTTKHTPPITTIALYTWNIDFMLPFPESRMKPALAHLDQRTRTLPPTTAPIIFLQECTPSDLATIAATPSIQSRFHLTDTDPTNWATTQYGTTVLVDARLHITSAFRVHYAHTRMDRDALFVDISAGREGQKVRLCNTHLESMALDPPFRPLQMQLIAGYLHQDGIDAALVAGDFNAIQPFDRALHVDNDLKDAFLELGGEEDTEEGYTWGQQAATVQRVQFGCSRMDKVYYRGEVRLLRFGRFGEGILAEGEEERREIVKLGFEAPWVTDHLGVRAEVEVLGGGGARGQL